MTTKAYENKLQGNKYVYEKAYLKKMKVLIYNQIFIMFLMFIISNFLAYGEALFDNRTF